MHTIGRHLLIELHGCPAALLNHVEHVQAALYRAAREAGVTLLEAVVHKFHPHGVTALALLSESHLSIHTWPEYGYAAADVFTCGRAADPGSACRSLVSAFEAKRHVVREIPRGEVEDEPPDVMACRCSDLLFVP